MKWVVVLIAVLGCGRVGFDPLADGTAARGYRDEVLADHPLAYWRLDDDGAVARDETGRFDGAYAATGCARSVPGALTGDPDHAVQFDGSACKIDVGSGFAFATNAAFSIELWYAAIPGGDSFQQLFARQTRNGSPIDGYALVLGTSDPVGAYFERVIGTEILATSAYAAPVRTFVHAVAVYDGSDSALYINGAQFGSFSDDRAMRVHAVNTFIGAVPDPAANENHFHGVIDEVAVYAGALPADRIRSHHEVGILGPR